MLNFKADKTFEFNASGVFGYNEWVTGKYSQKGDTIFLKYDSQKFRFGPKILNKDGELLTINPPKDSVQYLVPFKIYNSK